jgi:hypothetical protein
VDLQRQFSKRVFEGLLRTVPIHTPAPTKWCADRHVLCAEDGNMTARTVHGCGSLAEEELKAFLLKVAVVREDLGEAMSSHDVHGDTVRQAVVLIRALFIQREAVQERFMGLRLHGDARVREDAPHQVNGPLPQAWPCSTTDGEELG